jgi:hypothetical protein
MDGSNNKRLLLLIHPDAVFEISETHFIEEYLKRLEGELSQFDYVITHKMFSDFAPDVVSGIKDRRVLFDRFMNVLQAGSQWIGLDKKFSASFDSSLPDYLIENFGTQIWLAGGYENLCVRDTKTALERQLGDIIKDTQASIAGCYAPLIVTDRHRPGFGDGGFRAETEGLHEVIDRLVEEAIVEMANKDKTAIIIKGNPKYTKDNPSAEQFYSSVKSYLESLGYRVQFDAGEPHTEPPKADLWVGHSRGVDRLPYAPEGTRTVALGVLDGFYHPKDNAATLTGKPPVDFQPNQYHYVLTAEMKKAIKG